VTVLPPVKSLMFATLIEGKGPEEVDDAVVEDLAVLSVLLWILGCVPTVEVTVTVAV